MITKLEDFLRRRSQDRADRAARRRSCARPACWRRAAILFGDEAEDKFDEYFAELARRESLTPSEPPIAQTG